MKRLRTIAGLLVAMLGLSVLSPVVSADAPEASGALSLVKIAGYDTEAGLDEGGAEIVAYDRTSQRVYLINGATSSIEIVDLSDLKSGTPNQTIGGGSVVKVPIADHSPADNPTLFADVTSIAIHPTLDLIAAAVPNADQTAGGSVVFFTKAGAYIGYEAVGVLPDMITVTPDGRRFLTANEGQPNDDYTVDPEGSVSIIDVSGTDGHLIFSTETVSFNDPAIEIDDQVRYASLLTGYTAAPTPAQWAADFEPEYIVTAEDGSKAYVVLQESNAIAVLDLEQRRFTHVYGLGYKNYMLEPNKLDPSDRDPKDDPQINIAGGYPVLGAYMPDGMALKTIGGRTYLFTANEGDSRAYGPDEEIADEVRFKDMMSADGPKDGYVFALDAKFYPGTTQAQLDAVDLPALSSDAALGRLKLMNTVSGAVYYDPAADTVTVHGLYAYGGRSFSIWDVERLGTDAPLVYDSADDFEQIAAAALPDLFNSNHDENVKDDRSDDKGPEPEYVEIGEIDGRVYAFIGLERQSAVMVYDVTNPAAPVFVQFVNMRDTEQDGAGDLGPEGLDFVPAADSPTGKPLLLTGNEVSGTLAVFEIWQQEAFAVSGVQDEAVYAVAYEGGILRMTVKDGVTGFRTFKAAVTAIRGHAGTETVVFKHTRSGVQLGMSAVETNIDGSGWTAAAQFNAAPGDVIEVYVVDALSNDPNRMPVVLQ